MPTMEELNERFRADRFAAQAGVEIREAEPGRALCAMPLRPCHMNANGAPMGGAIFTLADFALALASNIGVAPSVSVSSAVDYMSASRGTRLIATCNVDKSGRHLGFYTTDVTDDTGRRIARVTTTVYREAE